MKYNLTKQEKKLLQQVLNTVYSFNTCNYNFLESFFKSKGPLFDKIFSILEATVIAEKTTDRLFTKDIAFWNLAKKGIILLSTDYFESIFHYQQKTASLFPDQIRDPDSAYRDINLLENEEHAKEKAKKIKKAVRYLFIANIVIGILVVLELCYPGFVSDYL